MSSSEAGDDLFPPSPPGQNAEEEAPPVASTSRTPSPGAESPSGQDPASPVKRSYNDPDEDNDDDGDDLVSDWTPFGHGQQLTKQFGDDDEDQKPATPRSDRGRSSTATPISKRSGSVDPLEYAEEEGGEEAEDPNAVTATLPLPKVPRMQATDGKVWHLKLPLYVNLDSRPYDGDYYKELEREEETIDGKSEPKLAKQKILTVKNTIRWKWTSGTDGKPVRRVFDMQRDADHRYRSATLGWYGGQTARCRCSSARTCST
jgi:RNA polymerase-associated protein LEO1